VQITNFISYKLANKVKEEGAKATTITSKKVSSLKFLSYYSLYLQGRGGNFLREKLIIEKTNLQKKVKC